MVDPQSTRARCVFCGSRENQMSKEHVWPEWVRKYVPDEVLAEDVTYRYSDSDRGEFQVVDQQPLFQKRVRKVCKPCNNEWMGRIEDRCEEHVEPIFLGRKKRFDQEAQSAV